MTKIPPHRVQNLYSERELSIKLLLGKKTKKKTNISLFSATHTYIKLTFVSFFFLFFCAPFPKGKCCRWFSYRKLCERISIIQRPRCWASKISGWEGQHFPLYIGLSKLKIVSRETPHPIVFLLPKGKVHQKKGKKS